MGSATQRHRGPDDQPLYRKGAVTVAHAPFLQTAVPEPLFRWEPYDRSYAADPLWNKEGRLLTEMLKVSFLFSFISYFFIGYWLFFYWVSGSYSVRLWISSLYLLLFREEYDFSCFLRTPTFHFAKFDLFTGAISANHKHSSPWIQVRQFVLAIRGKSFLHSRIRYYANSDSCFQ